MSHRKIWSVSLVVLILLVVSVSLTIDVTAQSAPQSEGTLTIPYTGRLTNDSGDPVIDGYYAIQFSLYTDPSAGDPLWLETQDRVQVSGGSFAVVLGSQIPIPQAIVTQGKTWLEVSLRAPAVDTYTVLSPRFELIAQADSQTLATSSCVHTHLGEYWTTNTGDYGLVVNNNGTSGDGIRGYANNPASNYAGLYGVNFAAGPGVYGRSDGGGPGVAGYSTGRGVYGKGADGVVGESSTTTKSGVYGFHTATGYGVTGRGESNFGVFAWGNDSSLFDTKGDLLLQGSYGEIFVFGDQLDMFSNAHVIVDLDDDNNSSSSFFRILGGTDNNLWTVTEPSGDVVSAGSQASAVKTADQGQRLLYSIQGTGVWLEDIGSSALQAGEVMVLFDPIYTQAVNLSSDYQVFVTATCNQPVLLYVADKSTAGFTVRGTNLDGSASNCSFDYRVIAERQGYEGVRLEQFTDTGKELP